MNQMQEIQESRDPKILPDVLDVLDDPPGGDRAEGGVRVSFEDLPTPSPDVVVVVLVHRGTAERRHSRRGPHPAHPLGVFGVTEGFRVRLMILHPFLFTLPATLPPS